MRRRLALLGIAGLLSVPLALPSCLTADPGVYPAALDRPPAADPVRIAHDVDVLAGRIGPRSPQTPEALDAAAAHIEARLVETGYTVTRQAVRTDAGTFDNLLAHCGPEDAPRFVFGAHYDSHPHTPGADDNASGTATVLELARLLRDDARPCASIRHDLVFYTLEEPPYFRTGEMGSAVHARALVDQHVTVRGMVSVEMVGTYHDAPGTQDYPSAILGWRYPDTGNFLAVIGRPDDGDLVDTAAAAMSVDACLPVYGGTAPAAIPGVDFSDHLNYWDAGFSAVMVTDTAYLRTAHYHEPTDTPDRLDPARMALVASGLWALARAQQSPP